MVYMQQEYIYKEYISMVSLCFIDGTGRDIPHMNVIFILKTLYFHIILYILI